MNIRVICLAVMFCVALGGTSLGACFPACDEDVAVYVYTKQERGYQEKYCGVWKMKGVCINGLSLKEGFYTAGKEVYDCPGPSAFLEKMMDEMRSLCKTDDSFLDCADKPLSESIERGLTWVTTFPDLMKFCPVGYYGHYERATPLDLDMDLLRPVVKMISSKFIIQGFCEERQRNHNHPSSGGSYNSC